MKFDTNPAVIKDFHHSPAFVAAFARSSRINYLNTADIGLQGSMGMSEKHKFSIDLLRGIYKTVDVTEINMI